MVRLFSPCVSVIASSSEKMSEDYEADLRQARAIEKIYAQGGHEALDKCGYKSGGRKKSISARPPAVEPRIPSRFVR
jgi:hypothetical protein